MALHAPDPLVERLNRALAGRFSVQSVIGSGGMGTVYLAEDLRHHRQVALKVLRPELASAVGAERFLREIRLAAQLHHPHILQVHDSGEADGLLYFVMPYIEGESLRDRLERLGRLSVSETINTIRDVLDALGYAHDHRVVHRDIKPDNIMLQGRHAFVSDFGVAKAIQASADPALTTAGMALGTPTYMAPEQALGDSSIDHRADLYAVGAMAFEMLTGGPPHTAPTAQALLTRKLTTDAPDVRAMQPDIPPQLAEVVTRALAREPEARWLNAAEMLTRLEDLRTPSNAASVAFLPQRRRRALAVGVATLGALVILLGIWRPWRGTARAALPSENLASVAVLPFDNLSGSTDSYLTDGITDEIIGQLAQLGGLKVISRTSSVALKGTRLTLRQVAETLGVRHILEGSVRHEGIKIRVTVDLIDANTDAHVWVANYDRDLTSILGVQQDIARQVADTLGSMVGLRPRATHLARTEEPGTYEAYLRGQSLMYQRTREALLGAREQFLQSIAHDSIYAPAYAGLARWYSIWASFAYGGMDLYDVHARAIAMADRAIRLDSNLAEPYAIRGLALLAITRVPQDSITAAFKRALALRPNSAEIHEGYAHLLTTEGRHQEALAEVQRAITLDPLAPGTRIGFAAVALGARRFDLAAQEADRAAALQPNLRTAREIWLLAQLLSGHPDRCAARDAGVYRGLQAMCLYTLGRSREAAQIVDSLRGAITHSKSDDSNALLPLQQLAEYSAWIGDATGSLSWLERVYSITPGGEDPRNFASGIYDKVQNDPDFQAGLKRIHEKVDARLQLARRTVKGL